MILPADDGRAGAVGPAGRDAQRDERIDVGPCSTECGRSCACSRRALRALLAAIGVAGSADAVGGPLSTRPFPEPRVSRPE